MCVFVLGDVVCVCLEERGVCFFLGWRGVVCVFLFLGCGVCFGLVRGVCSGRGLCQRALTGAWRKRTQGASGR